MDHLCYFCLVFVMLSHLLIACCERADLLALVCVVKLCFCYFPMWYSGSSVVLDCIDS